MVNGEDLHVAFLDIYREHANFNSLCPEIGKYAESARSTGQMLQELGRQLSVTGRSSAKCRDVTELAGDLVAEASTWQLLGEIVANKDAENEMPDVEGVEHSELLAAETIYAQNDELRHLKAVVDWLEFEALENVRNY